MLRPLSFVSLLSIGSLAGVLAVTVAAPACTVTELDDDDDDDDGGEGEGEAGEGEGEGGEGEGEGVPGPEDFDTACSDGFDNDDDDFVDCDDFDCEDTAVCAEQNCSDGLDDNGNSFTDCEDFACDLDPACAETCDDGVDNDGDGRVDCADAFCNGGQDGERDPACILGVVEIQDIQANEGTLGALASVENVFVTSVNVSGTGNISMFLQEPDGEGADYPKFAGIGVFVNAGSIAGLPGIGDVAEGDCINLSGEVDEFQGLTQLSFITAFSTAVDCGVAPTPTLVTVEQIATDADPVAAMAQAGVDAEAFEGVLVRVEQVTASEDSQDGDYSVVDADENRLEINAFLLGDSAPEVTSGTAFTSITGVLSRFQAFFQLQPRSLDDIEQ
jgi:hypothetical protein